MKEIYEVKGELKQNCSQSHIKYSFFVEEEYESISILFEYDPKKLEDEAVAKELVFEAIEKYENSEEERIEDKRNWKNFMPLLNHVTLSFDDPKGFRGATHRHDHKLELNLDDKNSSPGLENRANASGMWSVTLDVHALVTETCTYKIKVLGK